VQKLMLNGDGIDDVAVKQLNTLATKYPNTRAAKKASHLIELSKM
jgi:TolA-binding protein